MQLQLIIIARRDSHQYSHCQGTATEDATTHTSIQAEADTRLSSASDVSNVEVVSRESAPPEHVRIIICVCMCMCVEGKLRRGLLACSAGNDIFTPENHRFVVERILYPTKITRYTVFSNHFASSVHYYTCLIDI